MSSVSPRRDSQDERALRILELTSEQFIDQSRALGRSAPSALALYRTLYREGRSEHSSIEVEHMPLTRTQEEGATIKFTQRLHQGEETESVLIPMRKRNGGHSRTLCVSSQIGCAMGVRLLRNRADGPDTQPQRRPDRGPVVRCSTHARP